MAKATELHILHFNDVYNMTVPATKSEDGTKENQKVFENDRLTRNTFDQVLRFTDMLNELRGKWDVNDWGVPQGLVLFSGDLFSPSVESMLTKGRNMVHLMNELGPDAAVPGNHEFDFGRDRFNQLTEFSNFNWVLSNIKEYPAKREQPAAQPDGQTDPTSRANPKPKPIEIDFNAKGKPLTGMQEYCILERHGLKIGIIGLMSKDTLTKTNKLARANLKPFPECDDEMISTAANLSKHLRKNKGCDLVFALTHAEHSEDVELARAMRAYPVDKQPELKSDEQEHYGVDVIFGGHNHTYYLGKGVELDPEGYKGPEVFPDFDNDANLLIVKSGYDFNDLSGVTLVVEDGSQQKGLNRKKVVKSLKVKRHHTAISPTEGDAKAKSESTQRKHHMATLLRRQYDNEIMQALDKPIAKVEKNHDIKGEVVRRGETDIGNWIADSLLDGYKSLGYAPTSGEMEPPDICFFTGGSIRSDGLSNGLVLTRHIISLLPFESRVVTLKLTAAEIMDALEVGLSKFGADTPLKKRYSGAFPVFSGMSVKWDPNQKVSNRVQKVWVGPGPTPSAEEEANEKRPLMDRTDNTKYYSVLTNSFLADSGDGFKSFQIPSEDPRRYDGAEIGMYQLLMAHVETNLAIDTAIQNAIDDPVKAFFTYVPKVYEGLSQDSTVQDILTDIFGEVFDPKDVKRVFDAINPCPEENLHLPKLNIKPVENRLLAA